MSDMIIRDVNDLIHIFYVSQIHSASVNCFAFSADLKFTKAKPRLDGPGTSLNVLSDETLRTTHQTPLNLHSRHIPTYID